MTYERAPLSEFRPRLVLNDITALRFSAAQQRTSDGKRLDDADKKLPTRFWINSEYKVSCAVRRGGQRRLVIRERRRALWGRKDGLASGKPPAPQGALADG